MEKQHIAITTEEVQGIIDLAIARALAAHDDGMVKGKCDVRCNVRGASMPDAITTPIVSPLIPMWEEKYA